MFFQTDRNVYFPWHGPFVKSFEEKKREEREEKRRKMTEVKKKKETRKEHFIASEISFRNWSATGCPTRVQKR